MDPPALTSSTARKKTLSLMQGQSHRIPWANEATPRVSQASRCGHCTVGWLALGETMGSNGWIKACKRIKREHVCRNLKETIQVGSASWGSWGWGILQSSEHWHTTEACAIELRLSLATLSTHSRKDIVRVCDAKVHHRKIVVSGREDLSLRPGNISLGC